MPEPCSSENYAYILECADGTLYCGWTNDLQHRLETHNLGKGGKYTRTRLPVKLVYYETYGTKEEAMSREWHLKQLSRKEKLLLISSFTEVRLSSESDPASSSQPSDPESRR